MTNGVEVPVCVFFVYSHNTGGLIGIRDGLTLRSRLFFGRDDIDLITLPVVSLGVLGAYLSLARNYRLREYGYSPIALGALYILNGSDTEVDRCSNLAVQGFGSVLGINCVGVVSDQAQSVVWEKTKTGTLKPRVLPPLDGENKFLVNSSWDSFIRNLALTAATYQI